MLDALIAITAPITTLAAEEMHLNRGQSGSAFSKGTFGRKKKKTALSDFSLGWLHPPSEWRNEEIAATFAHVLSLRSAINQAVEALVAAKLRHYHEAGNSPFLMQGSVPHTSCFDSRQHAKQQQANEDHHCTQRLSS